jgi:hypothetical protein
LRSYGAGHHGEEVSVRRAGAEAVVHRSQFLLRFQITHNILCLLLPLHLFIFIFLTGVLVTADRRMSQPCGDSCIGAFDASTKPAGCACAEAAALRATVSA